MKTQSAALRKTAKKVHKVEDRQLEEFARRDLGSDLRASGTRRVVRRHAHPTSILLDDDLIKQLAEKGARRGLGYQTMLKLIVREHLHKY
jgi:predicted DNA binding CopG/RHH family protein